MCVLCDSMKSDASIPMDFVDLEGDDDRLDNKYQMKLTGSPEGLPKRTELVTIQFTFHDVVPEDARSEIMMVVADAISNDLV
jgi:hypothetical protein